MILIRKGNIFINQAVRSLNKSAYININKDVKYILIQGKLKVNKNQKIKAIKVMTIKAIKVIKAKKVKVIKDIKAIKVIKNIKAIKLMGDMDMEMYIEKKCSV